MAAAASVVAGGPRSVAISRIGELSGAAAARCGRRVRGRVVHSGRQRSGRLGARRARAGTAGVRAARSRLSRRGPRFHDRQTLLYGYAAGRHRHRLPRRLRTLERGVPQWRAGRAHRLRLRATGAGPVRHRVRAAICGAVPGRRGCDPMAALPGSAGSVTPHGDFRRGVRRRRDRRADRPGQPHRLGDRRAARHPSTRTHGWRRAASSRRRPGSRTVTSTRSVPASRGAKSFAAEHGLTR